MTTSIGYEHLKAIYLLKEAQAKHPLATSSAYILPLMAMQSACRAFEAYITEIGRKLDPAWDEADWKDVPIKDQLALIYKKTGQTLDLNKKTWQEMLKLIEQAGLIQEDLAEMQKLYRNEIPEHLKDLAVEYPIYRSKDIAETAIDTLLEMSEQKSKVQKDATLLK